MAESWKPIYFGVKRSWSRVTKALPAWVFFALLWVLAACSCWDLTEVWWCGECLQVPVLKENRCKRCSRTFDDAESLDRHISTTHGSPGWHLCHLCADAFSTSRQLERHVETRHCGKAESSHGYVCALCAESPETGSVSYAAQGLLTKHLRTVHCVPRKAAANMARAAAPLAESSDNADQVGDSPNCSENEPVKRLYVSGETTRFQCSRCEFSAEDRAVFVAHATEHSPTIADAVQCKECATSFTVASALYRHLRIVHRINCDIDTYLRENGGVPRCPTPDQSGTDDESTSAPKRSSLTETGGRGTGSTRSGGKVAEPVKSGAGDEDDAPAECTVCYRVFLTKLLLRAHMRVHGMAFIQRTRRSLPATTKDAGGSLTWTEVPGYIDSGLLTSTARDGHVVIPTKNTARQNMLNRKSTLQCGLLQCRIHRVTRRNFFIPIYAGCSGRHVVGKEM